MSRCSSVCGITPSSAATVKSTRSMPCAPASMLRMNRSCPGTSTTPARVPSGQIQVGEPEIDGDAPLFFFLQPIGVLAGERLDEACLPVVDVPGGADDQTRALDLFRNRGRPDRKSVRRSSRNRSSLMRPMIGGQRVRNLPRCDSALSRRVRWRWPWSEFPRWAARRCRSETWNLRATRETPVPSARCSAGIARRPIDSTSRRADA